MPRPAAQAALAGVLVAVSVISCSNATPKDERPWFRGYVHRAEVDLTDFRLQPSCAPFVGPCDNHSADVSWQGRIEPDPHSVGDLSAARTREEVSKNVSERLQVDAGLPAGHIHIIQAHSSSNTLTDTAVLTPARGTRVQVSVPDTQTVLVAGYVGC